MVEIKRNSVVGSRAADNGDTVTGGMARRAERYNTVTVPFVPVAICYFVHIHNGVTSHRARTRCILSLSRRFFFSPLPSSLPLSLPSAPRVFFSAFRFHVRGYQSVVVIHQRPAG